MKLSVKWLAGMAVLALAVVAVVSSTSSTKAATGSIFVANEWSLRTNESPAPSGYVSTGTVYSTFDTATRLIQPDSDLIRIIVKDEDPDVTTTEPVVTGDINVTSGGTGQDITAGIGQTAVIELDGKAGTLIAGTLAQVQEETEIFVGTTDLVADGSLAITNFFAGSLGNDPWIQVVVNVAGPYSLTAINYQTSDQNSVGVKVKSDLESSGVTVLLLETGLSTDRFEGFITLVDTASVTTTSLAPGDQVATIRTTTGPITLEYIDDNSVIRTTQVVVDTSVPTASVTSPAHGSATQNRTPTFSGAIADTGSGLRIDFIEVLIDNNSDPNNTAPAVTPAGVTAGGVIDLAPSTSGSLDGDLSFSFSKQSTELPNTTGTIDHIVDWVIKAADVAGNIGFSDADPSDSTGTGNGNIVGGFQIHTVKIDQQIPSFQTNVGNNKTGLALDSAGDEVSSRRSIRVVFNDFVQNVQASDFVVTLDSGTTAVPSSVTIDNGSDELSNENWSAVYLGFPFDLVSNETPAIALQDTVMDLAGNSTAAGNVNASDGIKPALTVTLLNGSGTGTGSEGPDSLTNDEIQIQVASDEALSNVPAIQVYEQEGGTVEATPTALSQGTNLWRATYAAPGAADTGDRAVVVTAADSAANSEIVGDEDTKSFTLDVELPTPALSVGGGDDETSQLRPFITIDFGANGESSTVTVNEVLLDGTDVTGSLVASSDRTRFFIAPDSDLSLGAHEVEIPVGEAVDAAGNENGTVITVPFTIVQRETFNIEIFAGWNAISFTSDPVDPDVNAVFPNAGHDAVLQFDANVPGMWRIATRDAVSGELTTTSQNGLSSVMSTRAYWVHSNNFEPVGVELVGETLPNDGGAPAIPMIQTVAGFNAIPVLDTSRKQTQGDAGENLLRTINANGDTEAVEVGMYLGSLEYGRVYRYSPETLTFITLADDATVMTGWVLFVEITGDPAPFIP